MLSFIRSVGRSDGLCALLPAGLDSLSSRLTSSLYSLSGREALLPWLAVSLSESLLFSDSKHAILVRMYNRHDHHLRSRSVSSWLFVRTLVRSFLLSFGRSLARSSVVRPRPSVTRQKRVHPAHNH